MSGTNLPATEVATIVSGGAPPPAAPAVEPSIQVVDTPTIVTPASLAPEPVVETPAEPVVEPVETPAEPTAEAPSGDAVPTEEKPESKPTLIEGDGHDEKKPDQEEKPAAEGDKKPPEGAETVTYEAFKLPEGLKVDEPTVEAFTKIIGPHKIDQETAQKLVDLHSEKMQSYAQYLSDKQYRDFDEMANGWRQRIMDDPILGGAGHQTALQAAAGMRDLLVPEEHRKDFIDFMRSTRAGDHIAIFRIFHNAARFFAEPAAPAIPARPIPDRGGNARQSKGEMMYDHPTSRRAAGR